MIFFTDPTGLSVRNTDAWGRGAFKASRGDRIHRGADFICEPGKTVVVSPVPGMVLREARPYANLPFSGILIQEKERRFWVKMFYLQPYGHVLKPGYWLAAGEPVGVAQDIAARYAGMIPHIHVEIELNQEFFFVSGPGQVYLDPEKLL